MTRTSYFFLRIVVAFIMTPLIVRSLGDRMYGLWSLIATLIGYYGLIDLGLSSAVGRFVSREVGKGNDEEINKIINTSLVLYSYMGLAATALSLIVAGLCTLFINNYVEAILFRKIIMLLGIVTAFGFPMRVFEGILISHIRYDLVAYAGMTKVIGANIAIYLCLKEGFGLLAMAIIMFIFSFCEYSLLCFFALRLYKKFRFKLGLSSPATRKSLFEYSRKTFVAQLADLLRFRVDPIVISGFLGLQYVTYYSIGSSLIDYFTSFIISAIGIMTPVFSRHEGSGDFDAIREKFIDATKISVILAVFVGANIIFYGKVFIQRWMGEGFESSYYVVLILCIPYIIALMQNPSIGLLYGISKHSYYAISNTLEGVLNLILSLVFVRIYGIYGVAMGTAISMIIFKLFIQPVYVCRILSLSFRQYYVDTLLITSFKTILPLIICFYGLSGYLKADYKVIGICAVGQMLVFIPVLYFFIFGKKERDAIRVGF